MRGNFHSVFVFIILSVVVIWKGALPTFADTLLRKEIQKSVRSRIEKNYPRATIDILSYDRDIDSLSSKENQSLEWMGETPQGARFQYVSDAGQVEIIQVKFKAVVKAPIAQKRFLPGERLTKESFKYEEIDLTKGMEKEMRGLILTGETDFDRLEARQTLLEGQYVLAAAVQKIHDIKRGAPVSVKLIVGDLTLTTPGTVQESAYLGNEVRVITQKTKKEMIGTLAANQTVEVK